VRQLLRSSSVRLAGLLALVFAVSLTVLFLVVYLAAVDAFEDAFDDPIDGQVAMLKSLVDDPGGLLLAQVIHEQLDGPKGDPSLRLLLQDADGRVIEGNLDPLPLAPGRLDLPPEASPGSDGGPKYGIRARQVRLSNGHYLTVGRDKRALVRLHGVIVLGFLLCLGAIVVAALGTGLLMSVRIVQRLRAINAAASAIAAGELERPIPSRGVGDEFDELASSFNAMVEQLRKLLENLRHVAADVAHDLRTPLSHLRQRLELARLRARTTADYDQAVEASIRDLEGVLDAFQSILRIAEVEAGARKAGFAPVDLSVLLQDLADTYAPVAEDDGHVVEADIKREITIRGDRQLLTQLFANLLENALRHTPQGTCVRIRLVAEGDQVLACVGDDGPGIPEPMRGKVTGRFVRLDRGRKAPGHGLGLAFVAAVAELHGAPLELEDARPGLKVKIVFLRIAAST
jgi:signal transduction histidine kinase